MFFIHFLFVLIILYLDVGLAIQKAEEELLKKQESQMKKFEASWNVKCKTPKSIQNKSIETNVVNANKQVFILV